VAPGRRGRTTRLPPVEGAQEAAVGEEEAAAAVVAAAPFPLSPAMEVALRRMQHREH